MGTLGETVGDETLEDVSSVGVAETEGEEGEPIDEGGVGGVEGGIDGGGVVDIEQGRDRKGR